MSRKEKNRITTSGGSNLEASPFAALNGLDASALPQAEKPAVADRVPTDSGALTSASASASVSASASAWRGRIDVRWEKSGRGGKVVTLIGGEGFAGATPASLDELLQMLKNRFGCGGTRIGAVLELQGKRVEQVEPVLAQMGLRVVRTGG